MPSITVTANFQGKSFASPLAVSKAVTNALTKNVEAGMQAIAVELKNALDKLYEDLAEKHGTAWPEGTTASSLSVRSGRGLRTIKDSIKVEQNGPEITGTISAGSLSVHETGATITPRKAQYLTVPLTPALNSQGLPLRSSAREWDNTFIATSRRGNLIIFQRNTGGKITPLYLLRKSVRIPPRLGMTKMFEDMIPHFERKAIDALEKALLHG
jgi:hypothetical protein